MNTNILFFLLVLIAMSCKNNQKATKLHNNVQGVNVENNMEEEILVINKKYQLPFKESLSSWEKLKKEHSDSYEYTVMFSSFTGYSTTTKIIIKNGVPFSREFSVLDPAKLQENGVKYLENKDNINTHKEGAIAKTIDELYSECLDYLNIDESTHNITFKKDKNGIVSTCGSSNKQCADDCFQGVRISNFKWLL